MTKKITIAAIAAAAFACFFTACGTTGKAVAESAANKNLDLSGYLMLGEAEMTGSETATPQGKLLVGRLTYKSRKVGIPADQKVPTAANFRATKSKSMFGAEDTIIEWDFTAGSDAEAIKVAGLLAQKTAEAANAFSEAVTATTEETTETPAAETQAETTVEAAVASES